MRVDMAHLLDERRWTLCNDPFPHIRAQNVFIPPLYAELAAAFDAILSGQALADWPEARFVRGMPNYDASGIAFDTHVGWPFSVFISRAWHDLFARLFAVEANGCIHGGLHHHAVGSLNGWIHNDLNPVWFADSEDAEGIVIPRQALCTYCEGAGPAEVRRREAVRAVAVIYYLSNPEWQPGDGGETGLYRSLRDAIDQPVATVPPLNNSLVAFECTPGSYHTFRSNVRHPRNSVVMWLHVEKAAAVARWGESALVRFS